MAIDHHGSSRDNMRELANNPYPGRGIVIGRLGETAIQIYWLMGRSNTSRNRVLVEHEDVVRAERFDVSQPISAEERALIEYNAMRVSEPYLCFEPMIDENTGLQRGAANGRWNNLHVVTNGNQTDSIIDSIQGGSSIEQSLLDRTYEPDAPNYTPRISAAIETGNVPNFMISIIKRGERGEEIHEFRRGVLAEVIGDASGLCLHTYQGDGNPLPSFDRGPYGVMLGNDLRRTAEEYWGLLNPDNRVALVAKSIVLATGEVDYHIINRHAPVAA